MRKNFKENKCSIIFILFIFLLDINQTFAVEKDIQVSLNLGAGLGSNHRMESSYSLLGIANANVSINELLLSIRNVKFVEIVLFGSNPKEYARDIAIMGGYRNRLENRIIDLSAGIAYISGLQRGDFKQESLTFLGGNTYESIFYNTIGIAVEFSMLYYFKGIFINGFRGFTIFANVNSQSPFIGITFTASFLYRNKN